METPEAKRRCPYVKQMPGRYDYLVPCNLQANHEGPHTASSPTGQQLNVPWEHIERAMPKGRPVSYRYFKPEFVGKAVRVVVYDNAVVIQRRLVDGSIHNQVARHQESKSEHAAAVAAAIAAIKAMMTPQHIETEHDETNRWQCPFETRLQSPYYGRSQGFYRCVLTEGHGGDHRVTDPHHDDPNEVPVGWALP